MAKSEYTNAFFFTILQKTLDVEPLCVNSHVAEEVNGNFEIVLKEDSKTTRGHDVFSMRGIFFFQMWNIILFHCWNIFIPYLEKTLILFHTRLFRRWNIFIPPEEWFLIDESSYSRTHVMLSFLVPWIQHIDSIVCTHIPNCVWFYPQGKMWKFVEAVVYSVQCVTLSWIIN